MRFLTEDTAPKVISEMLADAPFAKLAVAFWGDGAAARLGVGAHKTQTKIICNLESGACNPVEIRRLLAMAPYVEVRSSPRLHAKVYWTPNAAVVGSSNASSNGLAVEGRELSSWAEANILVDGPGIVKELSEWFDRHFDSLPPILESELLQAHEIWQRRRFVRAPGLALSMGLIDTCRKSIQHPIWQKTKIIFWRYYPSSKAEDAFAIVKAEQTWGEEVSYYEDSQDHLAEGDWIFDFPIGTSGKAKFADVWRVMPYSTGTPSLSFVRKSKVFDPDAFGAVQINDDDREQITAVAEYFLEKSADKRNAVVPILKIIEYLDKAQAEKSTNLPTVSQFERAMRNIYDEAKVAGYIANGFRRMLDDQGAMDTARRLALSTQPSPGFAQLMLLKRLDLTVESLIVKEPWRRLFEPEVVSAAQRRLRQFEQL